jgi:hypothetical protein
VYVYCLVVTLGRDAKETRDYARAHWSRGEGQDAVAIGLSKAAIGRVA